jgi:hypothetical protein
MYGKGAPSVVVECLIFLLSIREVPVSKLGPEKGYPGTPLTYHVKTNYFLFVNLTVKIMKAKPT